jgi:hypothetical protein
MERRDRADYHDPLAGFGGAPPAYSALTLRLVLALFGVIVCCAGAVIFALAGSPLIFVVVFRCPGRGRGGGYRRDHPP